MNWQKRAVVAGLVDAACFAITEGAVIMLPEPSPWPWFALGAVFFLSAVWVARSEIVTAWESSRAREWTRKYPLVGKGVDLLGNLGRVALVIFLVPWIISVFFGAVWISLLFFGWIVSGFDTGSALNFANEWLSGYGSR